MLCDAIWSDDPRCYMQETYNTFRGLGVEMLPPAVGDEEQLRDRRRLKGPGSRASRGSSECCALKSHGQRPWSSDRSVVAQPL
jgi:hypothetical protein